VESISHSLPAFSGHHFQSPGSALKSPADLITDSSRNCFPGELMGVFQGVNLDGAFSRTYTCS